MEERIWVLNSPDLRDESTPENAHSSKYTIHPGGTKMFWVFAEEVLVEGYEKGCGYICLKVFDLPAS